MNAKTPQNSSNTYVDGSNIFDRRKHCVAIGGAGCCCGCAGMCKALAAAAGSCRPVPSANFAISCKRPVAPAM